MVAFTTKIDMNSNISSLPETNRFLFILLSILFIIFNTVFEPAGMPTIPLFIGGARLFIQDLILWVLICFAMSYGFSHRRLAISSPISKYVVLFLLVVFCEAFYAIIVLGHPLFDVYNDCKTFFYYLLFFPVIWCFGSEKGVRSIISLWSVLAALGAIFFIYQFIFGELAIFSQYDFLYSRSHEVATGGKVSVNSEFKRLIMRGTVLFRIMLFVAICMWLFVYDNRRKWWGLFALLLAVQVALQFTRGMYITSILAIMVIPFLVSENNVRKNVFTIGLLGISVIGIVVFYKSMISTGHSDDSNIVEFIGERLLNAVTEYDTDSSLKGRLEGSSYMFNLIKTKGSWFYGLGFGSGIVYGDSTYVSILVKMGWLGLLPFLMLFTQACWHAFRKLKYLDNPVDKALVMALMLSTGRHLVNGITQSDFTAGTRIAALIVSVAIMEVIIVRGIKKQS